MFQGNILFAHFYSSLTIPFYSMSVLPGKKDGINSSIIGGYSIGIYKYISEKKKEAALEVIKYFSSKKFQKEIIVKQLGLITALEELYDDDEVCEFINCDMLHEIQYYLRPISTMENYNDFSKRAMNYFQDLLDGKKEVEDTLSNIDDINRVYFITMKNTFGAIIISFLVLLFVIVVIATSLIFIPSFQNYFTFFSNDLWIIYTIGTIMMLASAFEYFALPSNKKCILRQMFYINGKNLIYIPIIWKLTINYPIINNFSKWVEKHKLIFVSILYSIQFITSILNSIFGSIETVEINLDKPEKNFYICANNSIVGKAFNQIQYFYSLLLYLCICIFLFFEWNIEQTYFDIRHFSFAIIIDGISVALHYLFDFYNVNSYILYNILFIFINISFVIINHIYIFTIRTVILHYKIKYIKSDRKIISDVIHNRVISSIESSNVSYNANNANVSDTNSKNSRNSTSKYSDTFYNSNYYKSRILNIHYSTTQNSNTN